MKRAFVVVVLALLLTGVGVATAVFLTTGSGSGTATVGSLSAPSAPSVSASVSGDTVPVTWTGVDAPEGDSAVAYWVRRYAGATPSDACGSSLASPILAGAGPKSCDDTGVASGTYAYSVTAVWRSWAAESEQSTSVVVAADATGPSLTVTFPGASGAFGATTWNAGCASSICGTAADISGVAGVQVSLRQGTGDYWNGLSFTSGTEVLHAATGTTSWSLPFPASSFPADGTFTARVVGTDTLANTSSVSRAFVYDNTAPTGSVTAPANGASVRQTITVSSDSADATAGVASALFERSPAGTGTWTTIGTDTSSPYSVNFDTTALTAGAYDLRVTTADNAGNAFTSAEVTVTVDNSAPAVTLTTPASGTFTNSTTPALAGAAGNAAGDSSTVTVRIYQGTGTAGTLLQTLPVTRSGASWSTTASTLPAGTYTAQATQTDAAGNAGTSSANTFTVDLTGPAVTLTAPAGGATVRTTTPTLSGAAGTATGDLASVTVRIYSGTGTGGSLIQTIPVTSSGGTWSTTAGALGTGTYTAQASQADSAGNTGTSSANTFTVPPFAPTNVVLTNTGGTSGAGKAEKGDTLALTYSRDVSVSSLCSTWSGNGDQSTGGNGSGGSDNVVVTITDNGSNDVLTVTAANCTVTVGSVALGGNYVGTTRTFSGSGVNASSLAWTASSRVLTITLGAGSGSVSTGIAAGTPVYTPSASILDSNGNGISTAPFTAPATSRF